MNRKNNTPLIIDQKHLSYDPSRPEAPIGIPESSSPFISISSVPQSVFKSIEQEKNLKYSSMGGYRKYREKCYECGRITLSRYKNEGLSQRYY
jgi:hypothetical protein